MRISVNGGHTPAAPGASGYLDELAEDRKFKDRLIAALRARGHEVGDSTADDWADASADLAQQCRRVNAFGADLAISIHFNAGGGTGVEAFAHGADAYGMQLAAKISANLARAMGLPDRGAKDGSWLYFVANSNPTAVLIETCFVDRAEDKAAYDATSWDALCDAVCDAIEIYNEGEEDMTPSDLMNAQIAVQDSDGEGQSNVEVWQAWSWSYRYAQKAVQMLGELSAQNAALAEAVKTLAENAGADPDAISKAVSDAVAKKLESINLSVTVD